MSEPAEQSYANWALKYVGVFVGITYSLGFLTVSSHLSHYGVSPLSVLQSQYLAAGVWTIAPPITFVLVQRTTNRFSDRAWRFPAVSSWRRAILIPLIAQVPFGLLVGAFSLLTGGFEGFTLALFLRVWVFFFVTASAADMAWLSWRVSGETERWWLNRQATPFYATVFMLGVLAYALNFGSRVYPLIPYALGGGKPRTIVFIPGDKPLPIGIVKDSSSGKSVPYKLLTTTDKSYVVISPNPTEQCIEINRDDVQGIIVLKAQQ
jgi:hypothetical protein